MDKYAVKDVDALRRQELEHLREQIASYEAQARDGELTKTAAVELTHLLERAAALEEAIAAQDAV